MELGDGSAHELDKVLIGTAVGPPSWPSQRIGEGMHPGEGLRGVEAFAMTSIAKCRRRGSSDSRLRRFSTCPWFPGLQQAETYRGMST